MGLDNARRENNKTNSRFIMKVQEEDRRDKILKNIFLRSSEENPYAKQIAANIALCRAVAEEKYLKQTAEKSKMFRRQTNEDLRQLEYKLRAAYVSKAVTAQSFESKQLSVEEKVKTHHENQRLPAARLQRHEYIKIKIDEAQKKQKALKNDLQAQIASKEANRRKEQLSKKEDKKQMDEIVRQYREELQEIEGVWKEKKNRIRKEMDDFEVLQIKWRRDHNKADQKIQLRYEEFSSQLEENRRKALQERRETQVKRALKSEKIGIENHKLAEMKKKSLDFLTELLVEERNANLDLKSSRECERKSIDRINYRNDLINQFKLKKKRKICEKMQQDKLQCEILLVLKDRDALQQNRDEEKRKCTVTHRHDLLRALNEKKRFNVKEMKKNLTIENNEQVDLQRKKMEIERLGDEIILGHAHALKGFFGTKVASIC